MSRQPTTIRAWPLEWSAAKASVSSPMSPRGDLSTSSKWGLKAAQVSRRAAALSPQNLSRSTASVRGSYSPGPALDALGSFM